MSEEKRWESAADYAKGYEDAQNKITEHYEAAKERIQNIEEREAWNEKRKDLLSIIWAESREVQVGYIAFVLFKISERIQLVRDGDDETVQDEILEQHGLHFITEHRRDEEYDEIEAWLTVRWDIGGYRDKVLPMIKRWGEITNQSQLPRMLFSLSDVFDETDIKEVGEEIRNAMQRTDITQREYDENIGKWDVDNLRRLMNAMGYTDSYCWFNIIDAQTHTALEQINEFWKLDMDAWKEECDKREMWATLHSDYEAQVRAYWSLDNKE